MMTAVNEEQVRRPRPRQETMRVDEDEEGRGTRPLEVEVVVAMMRMMVVKATLNRHACPLTHTQQGRHATGAMRSYGKERRTVVASIKS